MTKGGHIIMEHQNKKYSEKTFCQEAEYCTCRFLAQQIIKLAKKLVSFV